MAWMDILLDICLEQIFQMNKELIQVGLSAFTYAADQQRDQGWQGQLARKGSRMIGVDRVQEEFGRTQTLGKIDKKRVEGDVDQWIKIHWREQPIPNMQSVFSVYSSN